VASEAAEGAPGPSEDGSGAPDELFYHDGSWYLYKPRPIELPKFEFPDLDAELERMRFVRETQWLADLALRFRPQLPIAFINGVS
jgi:hypothetical protein